MYIKFKYIVYYTNMKLEKISTQTTFLGLNLKFEKIVLYSIYLLSILVPLLIGKPQLLVGSIINTLIVFTTLKYSIKKTIPVLLIPSIVATFSGILFGGASYFLLYVFPLIVFSNLILSFFISKNKLGYTIAGIILKGTFLLIAYKIMIELIGLPSLFISSAYLQFITASIGVLTGYTLFHFSKR